MIQLCDLINSRLVSFDDYYIIVQHEPKLNLKTGLDHHTTPPHPPQTFLRLKDLTQKLRDLKTQRLRDREAQRLRDLQTQRPRDLETQRLKYPETHSKTYQILRYLDTWRFRELETEPLLILESKAWLVNKDLIYRFKHGVLFTLMSITLPIMMLEYKCCYFWFLYRLGF